jgi:hypothetical protein
MSRLRCLLVAFLLALIVRAPAQESDKDLVVRLCTQCHTLEHYILPRSPKAWELTVENMKYFIWEDSQRYTDEEAARVVYYLGTYFDEESELDPLDHFGEQSPYETYAATDPGVPAPTVVEGPPVVAISEPAETAAVAAVTAPVTAAVAVATAPVVKPPSPMPEEVRRRLENPRWVPPAEALSSAAIAGYAAVFFLVALLLTGHGRRKLRRRFRGLHATAALGLFASLAAHGVIYLLRFGNPAVFWYWCGVASFVAIAFVELMGILRKRMGRRFLRIHQFGGYAALVLAILHWIWAWL